MGQLQGVMTFQSATTIVGTVVAVLGGAVLSGWLFFDSLALYPGWATMKVNAALGLLLAGVALGFRAPDARPARRAASRAAAAAVAILGLVTLIEYITGIDFGIDQLLAVDPTTPAAQHPGRMAPATAGNFVLIAGGLLLIDTTGTRQRGLGEIAAVAATLTSLLALLGYLYGVDAFHSIYPFSSIAPHTAAAFLMLGAGVIFARPNAGLMRHILSPHAGGLMARRLLPAAILVPVALGWLRLAGQEHGFYKLQLGTALLVVANIVIFAAIILWNVRSLNDAAAARNINQRIFETSPDLILIVDRKGNFLRVSPSSVALLNYRPTDMVGRNAIEFIHPDDLEDTRREMRAARRGGHKSNFECRYARKDGGHVTLAWTGVWSEAEQQHIFIGRDVSERNRAEEEVRRLNRELEERVQQRTAQLKDSEARAARAHARLIDGIESLSDGFLLWDADDRLVLSNEASRRADVEGGAFLIPGRRYAEILELRARSGHIPEALGREEDYIRHRLDRHTNPTREPLEQKFDNGQWVSVREERTREGGVVSIRTDITERKQAEEALRQSEERFRLLVDSVRDYAIFMLDAHGKVTSWNSGAERFKGYRAAEIIGKHFSVFYPDEQIRAGHPGNELERARNEGRYEEECWRVRKDGSRFWARVTLTAIRGPDGGLRGFSKITRDMTEPRAAGEALLKVNQELERRAAELDTANRELEAFSYSVSHDLRAPLRAIDAFSQAILEDYADRLDEKGRGYLGRVRQGAQRMGLLIDDMLQLAKVTRAQLQVDDIDLSALASEIWQELQRESPQRQVEFAVSPGLRTRGDARLLRIVFDNLLRNAWKFTGGRTSARIEFAQTLANGTAAYFVRDNGAGFDMAYADKLFGVFQRLHNSSDFPGTGVGLATVQRVIHKHGGRIWADAKVNEGATFYFTL